MNECPLRHVYDSNRAVAQFGNEQTLPGRIESKMVDPAADIAKRDLALKLQGFSIGRETRGGLDGQKQPCQHWNESGSEQLR
jgi:hypothetical protein